MIDRICRNNAGEQVMGVPAFAEKLCSISQPRGSSGERTQTSGNLWKVVQRAFVCVAVVHGICTASVVHADPEPVTEPAALAKLVSPKDESPSGTLINEHNLSEYDQLIPDELLELIKTGEVSLTAFRSLRFNGAAFDDAWMTVSQERAAAPDSLESAIRDGLPRGFLYQASEKILENLALTVPQQAAQLLWNAQAPLAARASFGADFTLSELGGTQGFSLRGSIQRIVPRRFRTDDRTGQLFRERIRVESPHLLKGLAWLTFRFTNQQEDVVWAYSPAIKKTRQLTSTNRSDPFLGSPVAVDDLFGFSGKIQSLEAISLSRVQALAPFLSLDAIVLKEEAGCLTAVPERKRNISGATLTIDGRDKVAGRALPDMNFVPRELVRMELLQGDPYSAYGRQVLYLDRDTFFPFYKFVYDRSGVPLKMVITAAALAATSTAKTRVVLPTSSFTRDIAEKRSASVTYDRLRFCEETDPSLALSEFDPRGIAQPDEKSTSKKTGIPDVQNAQAPTPANTEHSKNETSSSQPLSYQDIP